MDLKNYRKQAKKTVGTQGKEAILNWGLGVAGEAGDLAGCIKKTYFHKNDQKEGVRENIGDVMWYLIAICDFYSWELEDILDENIEKLAKRYPEGKFTYKHAKRKNERVDWNEK